MQGPGMRVMPGAINKIRVCACGCGREFLARNVKAKYYGPDCKARGQAESRRKRRDPWVATEKVPIDCVICGTTFLPRSKAVVTCSRECSQKRNWQMNSLRLKEQQRLVAQSAEVREGPPDVRQIPVEPIRDLVIRSGVSMSWLAKEVGFWNASNGDTTRIQRRLGMVPNTSSKRRDGSRPAGKCSTKIDYDLAVKIIRVLRIDPVDVPGGFV